MKFLAHFIGQTVKGEYYRIVFGDNPNEATKAAERFCKKGFIVASVKQAV